MAKLYASIRGSQREGASDMPHWDDLPNWARNAFEACYDLGIIAAAGYVDGNWGDAHAMAKHLREVGNGDRPMYRVPTLLHRTVYG